MFRIKFKNQNKRGFSLLEIILAVAIFSGASISVGYLIIDASKTTDVNSKKIGATYIAREGLEAVRSILDADGADFSDDLPVGQHGLAFDGEDWTFDSDEDVSDDGIYMRVIDVGNIDSETKEVTSTVTAESGGRTISVSLSTIFTDWR